MRKYLKLLLALVLALALLVGLAHCWSATYNQPMNQGLPIERPVVRVLEDPQTLLYCCFSGGGTRAMSMGYHVVEEFQKIRYKRYAQGPGAFDTTTLRDEIDYTSGVSGGAFVSGALAVYPARDWPEFYHRAVSRNIQGTIILRLFEFWNWPRLLSPYYNRTDMASEFYHRRIFQRRTFGELPVRPVIYINSTVLAIGTHWVYDDEYFRYINSDLQSYPLAFACAGSSAFPVGFAPMTLKNYQTHVPPESLINYPKYRYALMNAQTDMAQRQFARTYEFLRDTANRWLHVSDGGIAGNTGIERVLDDWRTNGVINRALNNADRPLRRLIFVVVNAGTTRPDRSCARRSAPHATKVLLYTTTTAMDILSAQRTAELKAKIDELWQVALNAHGADPTLAQLERPYLIEINAQNLQDPQLEQEFNQIPTALDLSEAQLKTVRLAVLLLLAENPELLRLKQSIAKELQEARPW